MRFQRVFETRDIQYNPINISSDLSMYDPINDGMEKGIGTVVYNEAKPPEALKDVVHSYWQLKTNSSLQDDFTLHAIPDACINILLNQKDPDIAGITGLKTTYTYAGIQFFPGVWHGDREETKDSFIGSRYLGKLPLVDINTKTASLSFSNKLPVFTDLVLNLMDQEIVKPNKTVQKILTNLEHIHNVSEMAEVVHCSPRQLQRILVQVTGFAPHDFLKVMRLQQSLKEQNLDLYTDQSHFIRSFKKITGYTPTEYFNKYDV